MAISSLKFGNSLIILTSYWQVHFARRLPLNRILENINSYIITGINPIIDSLDMVLGHAMTDLNYRHELKESGFGKKLIDTFHFVASFTTLAAGIAQFEDLGKFYATLLN
ncbi:hypothetical protein H5187_22620 [Pseudoalteromonas sp. SG44-1]|nr:hypothetical protein [Pseudoalteromonas sp. SG44-1]